MSEIFKDMEMPFLPMLISNWIFGIGIIEYPLRKPHRVFSIIYTLITLSIYGYFASVAYSGLIITWLDRQRPTAERIMFYANISITVSVIVSGWFQSKKLHKCIVKAAIANYLLYKIGLPRNYSVILKRELIQFLSFLLFILLIIVINAIIKFINFSLKDGELSAFIIQNYPLIIVLIADSSFLNILGYAHYQFNRLNKFLKGLLTSTPEMPLHRRIAKEAEDEYSDVQNHVVHGDVKDYSYVIKTAKLAHLQLVKVCREANNIYGLHSLLSIIVALLVVINSIFSIYMLLNYKTNGSYVGRGITRFSILIVYIAVKITFSSSFCTTLVRSSVKTGDLISELYDEPLISENTKAEIRYFNVELIQNKLEFSAYGVLPIDLTLIQTMLSAIGTCVIMLMQFQKIQYDALEDEKNNSTVFSIDDIINFFS